MDLAKRRHRDPPKKVTKSFAVSMYIEVSEWQGCRGYGYPWIYPCVDIRLRQYPWIFMDTHGYSYVTALELATSQNHNKTKQNRLFVGQLVLVLN